jgi:predicted RNase H-like nuclease
MDALLDEHTGRGVGVDDVLDAHAVCWSAERMLSGHAERLPPEDVPVNGRGRRMEIWR